MESKRLRLTYALGMQIFWWRHILWRNKAGDYGGRATQFRSCCHVSRYSGSKILRIKETFAAPKWQTSKLFALFFRVYIFRISSCWVNCLAAPQNANFVPLRRKKVSMKNPPSFSIFLDWRINQIKTSVPENTGNRRS